MLFQKLDEAFGGQGVIDGGVILTAALCQGKCAWKLALEPDFRAR
jgi:hypothetical protein